MRLEKAKRLALCASMFGLVCAVPSLAVPADPENQRELDIIIRDFDVSHPDFENFQEAYWKSFTEGATSDWVGGPETWIYSGYGDNSEWLARRADYTTFGCANQGTPTYGIPIGQTGYPNQLVSASGSTTNTPSYVQAVVDPTVTYYGLFSGCRYDAKYNPQGFTNIRGYVHELCAAGAPVGTNGRCDLISTVNGVRTYDTDLAIAVCKNVEWSQPIYITPGMVEQKLQFPTDASGALDMYEPTIVRARYACDNAYFDQWYKDVDGVNLRSETVMTLNKDLSDPTYFEIDKNWNNGGYFPLDSVDETTYLRVGARAELPNQFGAQSLSIYCPPYEYKDLGNDFLDNDPGDLCVAWKAAGGPKVGTAAATAAASAAGIANNMGALHLRNYGFTMMGYAAFKYKKGAGEVFQFTGDDDMWIFVDGVLVVDLGGTHLAAPGVADMDFLSMNSHGCHDGDPLKDSCATKLDADGTWLNESWHHLHFFYADRQTDGSNMRIRSSLSELAPSRFGQPAVGKVVVTIGDDGQQDVSMLLNTALNQQTIDNIIAKGSDEPAIVVMRTVVNADGTTSTVVYGYYITAVEKGGSQGADGIQYNFEGVLKDIDGNIIETGIVSGDKIAFNFPYTQEMANDADAASNYGSDVWTQLINWSHKLSFSVKSTSGKAVEGPPDTVDDWGEAKLYANAEPSTIVLDSLIDRPDFTKASNELTDVAKSNDNELPLNYTADLLIASIPSGGGKNGNPTVLTDAEMVKYSAVGANGSENSNVTTFVGGKSDKPAMCYGNGDGSGESCTSIGFSVSGPFRLNVRVFDHLGHFVSQYQQHVDSTMLQSALGTGHTVSGCSKPLYGETGAAWVTAKIYPVSQNGRLIATGPYIYQATIVREGYSHCLVVGSTPQDNTVQFSRSNETYRFGYRRSK